MAEVRDMKKSTLITVYGKTDGTNTTGTFTLASEAFTNTPNNIKIDKGLKVKIWNIRIMGQPVVIHLQYSPNNGTSWITIETYQLTAAGEIIVEKRRPVIIEGKTGNELIRFTWEQVTAAVTYLTVDMEFEPTTQN